MIICFLFPNARQIDINNANYEMIMDIPIEENIVLLGEVGLAGEVRSISRLEHRLTEAETLGFKKAIVPAASVNDKVKKIKIDLHPVKFVNDAFKILF